MCPSNRDLSSLPARIEQLIAARKAQSITVESLVVDTTRLIATAFGCARCGVWEAVGAGADRRLRCLALNDVMTGGLVSVPDPGDIDAYFVALEQMGHVSAYDTAQHFATAGSFASRLEARRIRTLLAAAMVVDGTVRGTVTCTDVDRHIEWSQREIVTLKQVAALLALELFGR